MERIGIIAGNGKLPEIFLEQCYIKGIEPFPVYLFDSVEEKIKSHKNSIKYSVAQPGKIISYFKKNNISRLVMLGKVEKSLIFSNIKFDFTAMKILFSSKNKKDKNILKSIIDYIESEGIDVLPQNYLLDKEMSKEIIYTKRKPTEEDEKTIKIGMESAKMLTDIDAGQTSVVKNESVIALEAIEGTDQTILRGGELAGKGCIIVKAARRKQDYRIDIPTIGLETVKKVVEIGGRGIVIEAEKMLFIDQENVIEYADKNKIFIKGIKYE
ncbi:MAG: UDP-2,3-diacylglucosamine diphosphatase LpxI [Leptotrichiaceae bacterium]|nr:UDP-2,3-diacylglucosamine diphosphatase LpxI [Leptotrichiaceae bacterium]MBP6280869.1 UDP-2,3-diacylglucosamine diphosphatase LpxI [Leptotrichiaceae bacterium]MBP7100234.1 UDP-2,3-diacylglucosamine diphosphatase LpxI [Leptotrichiaceae bacterium]MBP7739575.1 UDP-2,3-diacylglucosamine diphosphatase LpxI [Leptotrichiaceae bacterium]MBP9629956.1 UDP-2,3-diacylglucosamine diphosphatase LpxI [Leptotrichiaceae bacterium]